MTTAGRQVAHTDFSPVYRNRFTAAIAAARNKNCTAFAQGVSGYVKITVFVSYHAAHATCRRGHLCELVLFLFVVERMELPDAEDRLSVGPVVVKA